MLGTGQLVKLQMSTRRVFQYRRRNFAVASMIFAFVGVSSYRMASHIATNDDFRDPDLAREVIINVSLYS